MSYATKVLEASKKYTNDAEKEAFLDGILWQLKYARKELRLK